MKTHEKTMILINEKEFDMMKHMSERQSEIAELISQLPNTVNTYYFLALCHNDKQNSAEKQAAILEHLEKQIFKKYKIDPHILQAIVKQIDARNEKEKKEYRLRPNIDHDQDDDDLMRILSLDDE